MAPAEALNYWEQSETCIHCGSNEFQAGWGPQTFIQCDCCNDLGVHVACHEGATGEALRQEEVTSPSFLWFCSKDCERISKGLVERTGRRELLGGGDSEYSTELVRYSTTCRSSSGAIDATLQILHSAFQPLVLGNGKDLIDMVCKCHEDSDDETAEEGEGEERGIFNFSNFRVFLLRQKGRVVSVATVRVFGNKFAEVPFVATKEGYRRAGNCKRLMRALDTMLHQLGVKWVIIPGMTSILSMWTKKFGYQRFSGLEYEVLERRVVMPDPESAVLVRKRVAAPTALKKPGAAATTRKPRSLRFASPEQSYKEASHSEDEVKAPSDSESDASMGEESSEGEDAEGEKEQVVCSGCGDMATRLQESPETGDLLCASCCKKEGHSLGSGANQSPAASLAARAGSSSGGGGDGRGGRCYNCSLVFRIMAEHEVTGEPECKNCQRYRLKKGQSRPPKVYQRSKAYMEQVKGIQPQQQKRRAQQKVKEDKGGGQSSAAAGPAARPPGVPPLPSAAAPMPARRSYAPAASRHQRKRKVSSEVHNELKRSRETPDLYSRKDAQNEMRVEIDIAQHLAGALLGLVQGTDAGSGEMLDDMAQRLERGHREAAAVAAAYAVLQAQHTEEAASRQAAEARADEEEQARLAAEAAYREELAAKEAQLEQFRLLFQQLLSGSTEAEGAIREPAPGPAAARAAATAVAAAAQAQPEGAGVAAEWPGLHNPAGTALSPGTGSSGGGTAPSRHSNSSMPEASGEGPAGSALQRQQQQAQVQQQQQQQQQQEQQPPSGIRLAGQHFTGCPLPFPRLPAGSAGLGEPGAGTPAAGRAGVGLGGFAGVGPAPAQLPVQQTEGEQLAEGAGQVDMGEVPGVKTSAASGSEGAEGSSRQASGAWSEELFGMLAAASQPLSGDQQPQPPMGGRDSRSHPAASGPGAGPSPATAANPAPSASFHPAGSSRSVRGTQASGGAGRAPVVGGVDAVGVPLLSAVQQLGELVHTESQGKPEAGLADGDDAVALALDVAGSFATDLEG